MESEIDQQLAKANSDDKRTEGCALEIISIFPAELCKGLTYITHTVHIPIHSKAPLTFVRNSPAAYESIQEMLDKLPQKQVIRECNSSYNSPIWPVLKLTGKWRLTIDNRPLNKQVPLSRWPMIHLDQELAKVKGAPFLLTVDIANGFWTMRVEPVDQYKLDFSFRNRQYTWKRCPSS